eukprot:394134_1
MAEADNDDPDAPLVVPVSQLVTFAGGDRDTKERRQAAFGFAHFSTEETTQQQIVGMQRNYGVDAILGLLDSSDPICQRLGANYIVLAPCTVLEINKPMISK